MVLIPTKIHGILDYAGGAGSLAAPRILRDRRASAILAMAGMGTLVTSTLTDYELGVRRLVPMRMHLMADAGTGAILLTAAGFLRRRGARLMDCAPLVLVGTTELVAAALTDRVPGDRTSPPSPPAETPESDVERTERADAAATPAPGGSATGDALVAQEASAAAAEAARIGGIVAPDADDPAMDPVYQAGGGEQDGWEQAEEQLIENATHGDGHGDPARDALSPELESDRSTAVYGEADGTPSTEIDEDQKQQD
jgi:hypothetical protein